MSAPSIVRLAGEGATLSSIEAAAGKLWLAAGGEDVDGSVRRAVEAFWRAQPGADPYWDFLSTRMDCDNCGERNRLENLSICPNCFNVYCSKHERKCACGHNLVG
ncbi:MAG: hypothetical protein ABL883_01575 [Terricaulis sp.]